MCLDSHPGNISIIVAGCFGFSTNGAKKPDLDWLTAAPGLIFGEDDDVAPDLVWISQSTLRTALLEDRKLHSAPELIIEVLSPGRSNEQRDRRAKLKLYSRGVQEYWIVDGQEHQVEVYRRDGASLKFGAIVQNDELLTSPLLPGFACRVSKLFFQSSQDALSQRGEAGKDPD